MHRWTYRWTHRWTWLLGALTLSLALLALTPAGPGHPHGELTLACTECHTTESWSPLASPLPFRHDIGGFPLTGAHAGAPCRDCHQSLVFSHVGVACGDCHRDAHAGELGFRCESCHDTRSWDNQRRIFDLHGATLFPLFAAHADLDCAACHQGQRPFEYATTPVACAGCHMATYQKTTDPNHVSAGFPLDCEPCHGAAPRDWREATFEHPQTFLLSGAHLRAQCGDCHHGSYAGTPRECVACHRPDFETARAPDHRAAGFSTECQICHGDRAWTPATFRHELTGFPLQGAHGRVDCADCHTQGYAGTPSDCVACHRADYDATRDPDHAAAAFPTSCDGCHGQNAWRPATGVDHDQTAFPLQGAHGRVDCADCHTQGYTGTPTDCVACHRADYDGARDPNHAAAGFPTSCQDCHDTNRWDDSNWNHDPFFPIYTGEHRGAWTSCADCHVSPSSFAVFECIFCHEHRRSEMDDEHRGVGGYQYLSEACYSCHPRGRE